MMEGFEQNAGVRQTEKDEIFSRPVRAGKRTYFFDVKTTRQGEYYLTITESKKRFDHEGGFFFEKHKIFLYREDFERFTGGLQESVEFINNQQVRVPEDGSLDEVISGADFTNISFEDLSH